MCSAGWRWAHSWTAPRRSPPPKNLKRKKRPNSPDPGGTGQSVARNGLSDTMSNHKPVKANPTKNVLQRSFVHYCWSVPPCWVITKYFSSNHSDWLHTFSFSNKSELRFSSRLAVFFISFMFLSVLSASVFLAWVTDLMFLFSKRCGRSKLGRPPLFLPHHVTTKLEMERPMTSFYLFYFEMAISMYSNLKWPSLVKFYF